MQQTVERQPEKESPAYVLTESANWLRRETCKFGQSDYTGSL